MGVALHEPEDRARCDPERQDDQDAGLRQRREVLGLPVAVRMADVRRPPSHSNREEGEESGDQVDAGVSGL